MVIRLVSLTDRMQLPNSHDVFRTILGWRGDLGYSIRVQGQEFNSFRRKTQSKALHELKLHRQKKLLYICDTFVHEFRPLDAVAIRQLLDRGWTPPGVRLPRQPLDAETVAAIIRITGGNFRLLNRLLTQIERILEINALQQVTKPLSKPPARAW
jgi:hypothetical protein